MAMPIEELYEDAFAVALSKEQVNSYCNLCLFRTEELKRCSACKSIYYCSAKCQKTDWKQHRSECKAISVNEIVADDGIRLVMRLTSLAEAGISGEVKSEYLPSGSRSYTTLEEHSGDVDEEMLAFLKQFKQFAVSPIPTDELILSAYKKVAVNSFAVSNQFGSPIGIALCIKLSVANHSCKPSVRVVFSNRRAHLLPTSDKIPVDIPSAAHSYIDELQPIAIRREILKRKYMLDCECEGCCDEERNQRMEAWCCGVCTNGWMKNSETSVCNSCGWQMTRDFYETCRLAEEAGKAGRSTLQRDDVDLCSRVELANKLLSLFMDTLHKYNVYRLPVLRVLYAASLYQRNASAAEKYGLEMLELQEQYQSKNDAALLYLKYGLAQVMVASDARDRARRMLKSLQGPYEKVYGKESQVVYNIIDMLARVNQ